VDPGTATYTMDRVLRDRLRSSQWHNTLSLGSRSQSEPGGPFRWKSSASAHLRHVALNPSFDYIEGVTDAWAPAVHERAVLFVGDDRWIIADRVLRAGMQPIAVHWHIDPEWQARLDVRGIVRLRHRAGADARLAISPGALGLIHADAASGLGWISPAYGRLVPATTIRAVIEEAPSDWIITAVSLAESEEDGALRRLEVLAAPVAGRQPVAVASHRGCAEEVTLFRASGPPDIVTIEIDPRRGHALTTDARLLHARIHEPGRLESICLVDGSVARFEGAEPVTILSPGPIPDLAVHFAAGHAPMVEASSDRPDISIEFDSRQLSARAARSSIVAHDRGVA
jgi:hypothetical protein